MSDNFGRPSRFTAAAMNPMRKDPVDYCNRLIRIHGGVQAALDAFNEGDNARDRERLPAELRDLGRAVVAELHKRGAL